MFFNRIVVFDRLKEFNKLSPTQETRLSHTGLFSSPRLSRQPRSMIYSKVLLLQDQLLVQLLQEPPLRKHQKLKKRKKRSKPLIWEVFSEEMMMIIEIAQKVY